MTSTHSILMRVGVGSVTTGLIAAVWSPAAVAQGSTGTAEYIGAGDGPTQAEDDIVAASSDCPTGSICVWEHDNYQGKVYRFSPPNQDANYTNGSPDWKGTGLSINDQISSYKNATGVWVQFYQNDAVNGWGATDFCGGPGSKSANLSSFNAPGRWNPEDSFSAHQTVGTSQPSNCYYAS